MIVSLLWWRWRLRWHVVFDDDDIVHIDIEDDVYDVAAIYDDEDVYDNSVVYDDDVAYDDDAVYDDVIYHDDASVYDDAVYDFDAIHDYDDVYDDDDAVCDDDAVYSMMMMMLSMIKMPSIMMLRSMIMMQFVMILQSMMMAQSLVIMSSMMRMSLCRMWRNLGFLFFQFIIPTVQVSLFCLAIGQAKTTFLNLKFCTIRLLYAHTLYSIVVLYSQTKGVKRKYILCISGSVAYRQYIHECSSP